MYQVLYSIEANNDLADIYNYYLQEVNENLADKILEQIVESLAKLDFSPYRTVASHKIAKAREFKIPNLSYRAFIVIDEQTKIVKILHIVHTSRMFPNSD